MKNWITASQSTNVQISWSKTRINSPSIQKYKKGENEEKHTQAKIQGGGISFQEQNLKDKLLSVCISLFNISSFLDFFKLRLHVSKIPF